MLLGGDEMGRTQGGNNNAYCQDNETSWLDWDLAPWQRDLLATTRHLARVRRELPALRQRVWALGRQVHDDGSRDMEWYAADGTPMGNRWDHPGTRVVQMYVAGASMGADSALVVINGSAHEHEVTLAPAPGVTAYRLLWDSDAAVPQRSEQPQPPGPVLVPGTSMRVYATTDAT
jgi:glycogen operon protein